MPEGSQAESFMELLETEGADGKNLLTGEAVEGGGSVTVGAWDVQVVEGRR